MSGKLILASEKLTDKKVIKQSNVSKERYPDNMLTSMKKYDVGYGNGRWPNIVAVISDTVIMPNTWYYVLSSHKGAFNLNITKKIDTIFDDSILLKYRNIDYLKNPDTIPLQIDPIGINAIRIIVNKSINPIGYYLPDYNSFIFGQIGWHINYSEIVISNIWLQILDKLDLI